MTTNQQLQSYMGILAISLFTQTRQLYVSSNSPLYFSWFRDSWFLVNSLQIYTWASPISCISCSMRTTHIT